MLIQGYFCKVNKYGKLKFRYLGGNGGFIGGVEDKTHERLQKIAEQNFGDAYREQLRRHLLGEYNDSSDESGGESCEDVDPAEITGGEKSKVESVEKLHLPFDDGGFVVSLPKWIKNPPADIVGRVGLICTLEVKAVQYNFTSKAKHNAGENIVGMQLVLVKVRK
jgi:hypothetical protein